MVHITGVQAYNFTNYLSANLLVSPVCCCVCCCRCSSHSLKCDEGSEGGGGLVGGGGLGFWLLIPESKREEIRQKFPDEMEQKKQLISHGINTDPLASWRRLI